jgi:hypothetical protein
MIGVWARNLLMTVSAVLLVAAGLFLHRRSYHRLAFGKEVRSFFCQIPLIAKLAKEHMMELMRTVNIGELKNQPRACYDVALSTWKIRASMMHAKER